MKAPLNEIEPLARSQHHSGKNRLASVDTMRGTAMVLVILQHCYHLIDPLSVGSATTFILYITTKMASVAFMAVSGMMISFFMFSTADWWVVYRRFAQRALLLLLVVHFAIPLARYFLYQSDRTGMLIRSFFFDYQITDTIALALLAVPFAIRYMNTVSRAVLAAGLIIVTPIVIVLYQPDFFLGQALKNVLFAGLADPPSPSFGWPLAPWFAIFLCGSFMGSALSAVKSGKLETAQLVSRMRKVGVYLAILGLVLTATYMVLKVGFGAEWSIRFFNAIYPSRTTTLLPIYLAILLWMFAYLMTTIDTDGKITRLSWGLSVFGRTSLFTYVAQFVFAHSLPGFFGLRGKLNFWMFVALFVISVIGTWSLSYTYGRLRGWIKADDFKRARIRQEAGAS
jgi:uncharacterized membrane protein